MHQLFEYEYEGTEITFKKADGFMVNATEMARAFGKRPSKWLELPSTVRFINSLRAIRFSDRSYVQTINGVGTWLHEDVALEFARWLSPRFAVWCNDKIKELLLNGRTTLNNSGSEDRAILQAMNILQTRVAKQQEQLQQVAPKINYYKEVLQSESTYNTNQIAKEIGMSAITLNKELHRLGVQYKQNGTWLLYYKYQNRGLTKTKTYTYTAANGDKKTSMQTVWTEKGRLFIHELINNKYNSHVL